MIAPLEIHYRTDVRIISEPDPNESGYTGNCLIAEKGGRYGLLTAWQKDYREVLPFVHIDINHCELAADGDGNWKHSFRLIHESTKIGFYLPPSVFSDYIFDNIYITEDLDTLIGIEQDGKYGYCEVSEIIEDSWPVAVYFRKNYNLKLETLSRFHLKKIQVQREDGKWALFNKGLEQQTEFVFNEPLIVSGTGEIIVNESNIKGREEFGFKQFFTRYGINSAA